MNVKNKMKNIKYKKTLLALFVTAVIGFVAVMSINYYVLFSQNQNILKVEEITEENEVSYIMVLGCGVFGDEPSDMLEDRLLRALEVAERLPESKVILSGNNSGDEYNEVGVMKSFCIEKGLDESRIICDDDGFSTGESVTNMKKEIGVEDVIIVTQRYHLYRALHIASQYDIEAYGVASNQRRYKMQIYYSLREVAARNKDFFKFINV